MWPIISDGLRDPGFSAAFAQCLAHNTADPEDGPASEVRLVVVF